MGGETFWNSAYVGISARAFWELPTHLHFEFSARISAR